MPSVVINIVVRLGHELLVIFTSVRLLMVYRMQDPIYSILCQFPTHPSSPQT